MAKSVRNNQNKIEVELKGMLSKDEHHKLRDSLNSIARNSERDNKISYFFVTENVILKVTDETSHHRAKITLKIGEETQSVLEELEVLIPRECVVTMVTIFKNLGFDKVNRVEQERTNYMLNGVAVALKYTDDWGYHFELETKAQNKHDGKKKRKGLYKLCEDLNIKPMTPEEIAAKIEEINRRHGFI